MDYIKEFCLFYMQKFTYIDITSTGYKEYYILMQYIESLKL